MTARDQPPSGQLEVANRVLRCDNYTVTIAIWPASDCDFACTRPRWWCFVLGAFVFCLCVVVRDNHAPPANNADRLVRGPDSREVMDAHLVEIVELDSWITVKLRPSASLMLLIFFLKRIQKQK